MKNPAQITKSLRVQKDLLYSPVQGSDVNKHLDLAPFWKIKFDYLNLVSSLVDIFRKISTCNFFFASINVDEFSSEIISEPLTPFYFKKLRSLELTMALVQVNRTFIHR